MLFQVDIAILDDDAFSIYLFVLHSLAHSSNAFVFQNSKWDMINLRKFAWAYGVRVVLAALRKCYYK